MKTLPTDSLPTRTDKAKEGSVCDHPEHDCLYHGDMVTTLDACPFPIKTDTFEVLAFGDRQPPDNAPLEKFAVVRYRKKCGHIAHDRIGFMEHVKDFDHYGTKFYGKDYSIERWQPRIEYFRQTFCKVCDIARHQAWLQTYPDTRLPKKKRLESFLLLMNYNFTNWREFLSEDDFKAEIGMK